MADGGKVVLIPVSDPTDSLDGSGFAAVPLDEHTLGLLLEDCRKLRATAAADPDIRSVVKRTCRIEWYNTGYSYESEGGAASDDLLMGALVESDDFSGIDPGEAVVVDASRVPTEGIRTECDEMHLQLSSASGRVDTVLIYWTARRKHCDGIIEAYSIDSDMLESWRAQLAAGGIAAAGDPGQDL